MLRIDSIKLPPEAGMAELAAEAARLLRMREKDILSLRLLRRSVDAREEVLPGLHGGGRGQGGVRYSPPSQEPEDQPAAQAPGVHAAVSPACAGGASRGGRRRAAGLFAALVLAQAGCAPSCWSGAARWSGGRRMWNGSGPRESWT